MTSTHARLQYSENPHTARTVRSKTIPYPSLWSCFNTWVEKGIDSNFQFRFDPRMELHRLIVVRLIMSLVRSFHLRRGSQQRA